MTTALTVTDAQKGLLAKLAANPAMAAKLAALQAAATSGISGGGPPILSCKSTSFVTKVDGVTSPVVFPENYGGDNASEEVRALRGQARTTIPAIILGAKEPLDKAWFAAKYKDGDEPRAPDCYSVDGIKPADDCALKQCESCAGCAQNMFGTGTAADGTPGAGKACSDKKTLAVFFSPNVYKFQLMPTALKAWKAYCNQLSLMGVYLPLAITKISFDRTKNYPCYTFEFGGMLDEAQAEKVLEKLDGPEVQEILKGYTPVAGTPALAAPQGDDGAAAKAVAEKKAADEKAAKAAKAAEAKAAKEAKDKADAEAKAAAAANAAPAASDLTNASDDDIASLLEI